VSTVYPRTIDALFGSQFGTPFIVSWFIGPNVVTECTLDDKCLGSFDNTIFVAKLSGQSSKI